MKRRITHLQAIAIGYFLMVFTGTLILMLPISTASGEWAGFNDAIFTAVSASCVTGLVVRDTATYWSGFGQAVILMLIQVGGLGFMTIATIFFRLLKKNVGLREKEIMVESLNQSHVGGILKMTRLILVGTGIIELVGAVLLSFRFIPEFGFGKGVWYSVFHSVSAFCNAGFDLMGGKYGKFASLVGYKSDPLVSITIMALITIGGIGFLVWDDILQKKWHFKKYYLHTKLVLITSAILTFGGAILIFLLERENWSDMTSGGRILSALFASVTPRTAGFNTTDIAAYTGATKLITIILMFIGGSSGSTAGGVKTTTIAVLFINVFSRLRHNQSTVTFGREIDDETLRKASTIFMVNLTLALTGTFLICAFQHLPLTDVMLETFSAIGTVGMTSGITRSLTIFSRYILVFLMYCGRVGSVSFALALLEKRDISSVRYPKGKITIG